MELSEDQQQFKDVVQRFFADKSPPSVVRQLMAASDGYDPAVWRQLSRELGLAGSHIPEAYGGFGFGPVELGLVAEEMGRSLYCGPFFASSIMAGFALLELGSESAKQQTLPMIADGSLIATLVLDDLNDAARLGRSLKVTGGKISGRAGMVLDAGIAGRLLVIAKNDKGLGLYQVEPLAKGVSIESLEVLDPTRKLYAVQFNDTPFELLGQVDSASLQLLWDRMCLTLAHEMIGGAQYLLDSTIEYTKLRVQFGRQIGSFQSMKHRCADMLMELELAKSVVRFTSHSMATTRKDDHLDDLQDGLSSTLPSSLPSMAKAMASDVYMTIAKAAVQLRGGIGFTWENDTHLWFKRAKSSEVFLGSPHIHRERMMCLLEESQDAAIG
ncbi:MAG: alkylation response protein AidB-like acyl-CoA dehydrogenase [Candidatus Azotimanducaceae bacterium]|jgi:alkylation response protein AidB-like acyl-CoA dehydrogenase